MITSIIVPDLYFTRQAVYTNLVSCARLTYLKRVKESGESCISQLYYWNVHCLAVVAQCLQSKPTLQDQPVTTNSIAVQLMPTWFV